MIEINGDYYVAKNIWKVGKIIQMKGYEYFVIYFKDEYPNIIFLTTDTSDDFSNHERILINDSDDLEYMRIEVVNKLSQCNTPPTS